MARLRRQDRVLLESLEDKYGTDAIATAIMHIANRQNAIEEEPKVKSPTEAVLDYIKYIEGVRLRMRELHWSVKRKSEHTLTDDIISKLTDMEDNIAEDLMGVMNFRIKVGAVVPTMTSQVTIDNLLCELHEFTVQLCACLENDKLYAGIVNELEDLLHDIGKWKYLATFD